MRREMIQILAAGLAGGSFAMIFHIRAKYLPLILIGSGLGWAAYLFADRFFDSRTVVMAVAAVTVTVFSEIGARLFRMPVSVIYAPAVIPLVPGSHLYYCIRGLVTNSHEDFTRYGSFLLEDTLGIVLGSIVILTFVSAVAAKKRKS